MRDATNTTKLHDELWTEWSEDRIFNDRTRRNDLGLSVIETEIFYGYRGLCLLFDRDMAIAHLNTAYAQEKVSDKLYEAIAGASGEGNMGIRGAVARVGL